MFLFAILPRNGTTDNTFIAPSFRAGIDKTCLAFFSFWDGICFCPTQDDGGDPNGTRIGETWLNDEFCGKTCHPTYQLWYSLSQQNSIGRRNHQSNSSAVFLNAKYAY
jgi:hypothetical protein